MKKFFRPQHTLLFFFLFLLFTSSSYRYNDTRTYIPIYMERSELEKSVAFVSEGSDLINPGKIYVYGNYIFVNERYKGVHVIDNSTPSNPQNNAFITAPGCLDIAIKDSILYVDNAVDLVAYDLKSHQVTQRIRNILPEPLAPDNSYYNSSEAKKKGLILVEWKKNTNAQ